MGLKTKLALALIPVLFILGVVYILSHMSLGDEYYTSPYSKVEYKVAQPITCNNGMCGTTLLMINSGSKTFHIDYAGTDGPMDEGPRQRIFIVGKNGHKCAASGRDNKNESIGTNEAAQLIIFCKRDFKNVSEIDHVEVFGAKVSRGLQV